MTRYHRRRGRAVLTLALVLTVALAGYGAALLGGFDRAGASAARLQDPDPPAGARVDEPLATTSQDRRSESRTAQGSSALEPADLREDPLDTSAGPLAPPGRLRIVARWSDDGSAAADRQLVVVPRDGTDRHLAARGATTRGDGTAELAGLPSGVWLVRDTSGTAHEVDVPAGESARVVLSLDRGTAFVGLVVDAHGLPVPGAHVWAGSERDHITRARAATTDSDGRFQLAVGHRPLNLVARADGHAPSRMVTVTEQRVEERGSDEVLVTLHLFAKRGAVRGRVTDHDGRGLAGAWVDVELGARLGSASRGGSDEQPPPPLRIPTDSEGRFAVPDVHPGPVRVRARAPGLAGVSERAHVDAGEEARVELVLSRGATLSGRVTNADGEPVAGARVASAGDAGVALAETHTRADGTYVLAGLGEGRQRVRASAGHLGEAEEVVVLESDRVARWDASLAFRGSLVGLLVDESGVPLGGWLVTAELTGPGRIAEIRTDPTGRFSLTTGWAEGHTLYAYRPGEPRMPAASRGEVVPNGEPIRWTIDTAGLRTSTIVGRALRRDGAPVAGAGVVVAPRESTDVSGTTFVTDDSGAFRATPLLAGHYTVWIRAEGSPTFRGADVELTPGATLDLGDLVAPTPGSLAVSVRIDDGLERAGVKVALVDAVDTLIEFRTVDVPAGGTTLTYDALAPGRYVVRARAGFFGPPDVELEVVADTEAAVEVSVPGS